MKPEDLCLLARKYCDDCTAVSSPLEACRAALEDLKANGGTLIVCGSFYLAGEVRDFLLKNF